MEILLLSPNCLRIKGKNSSVIVDPITLRTKTPADAVIFLNENEKQDVSKVEDYRVILSGPGEYEFSGVKVLALGEKNTVYSLNIDGMDILLGNVEGIEKYKDKLKEHSIVIFYINSKFDGSLITALEPKVVVYYGEQAMEAVSLLGKDNEGENAIKPVLKYVTKLESLPEKMETVFLASS